jgi:5-methylcytosine-specific restriction endonuclease McrA
MKFTGLTCEHETNCRATNRDPWWTVGGGSMSQRKRNHLNRVGHRAAAGGQAPAAPSGLHSVETVAPQVHVPHDGGSVWGRRRVLLLNSTYEPLTALPMRRAVIMLLCGKADVVHDDPSGPVIHSATRAITVPSVIRLRTYVRVPYRARIPMTRAALMHRDRFRCAYCGGKADTVDHVVPRSRGGEHTWENCVACCSTCNHRKADKMLSELGWALRMAPMPPKGQHWRLLSTVKELDPAWVRYLGEGAA